MLPLGQGVAGYTESNTESGFVENKRKHIILILIDVFV